MCIRDSIICVRFWTCSYRLGIPTYSGGCYLTFLLTIHKNPGASYLYLWQEKRRRERESVWERNRTELIYYERRDLVRAGGTFITGRRAGIGWMSQSHCEKAKKRNRGRRWLAGWEEIMQAGRDGFFTNELNGCGRSPEEPKERKKKAWGYHPFTTVHY